MLSLKNIALFALPAFVQANPALPAIRTVFQDVPGTRYENIAVRPDGSLLVTALSPNARVYLTTNPASRNPSTEILVHLPADVVQSATGITQVETEIEGEEKYLVWAGNFTSGFDSARGTWKAFALTFDEEGEPAVEIVSDLDPNTKLPNGATSLDGLPNVVLVCDSANGVVGRLNISTGVFEPEVFSFPEFAPGEAGFGVNGLKTRDGYLYFSQSHLLSIYRIPITDQAYPAGVPELVADISSLSTNMDDFDFDRHGNIFITTILADSVVRVDAETGEMRVVVGGPDDYTIADDTSLAFGRGRKDKDTFYIVTGSHTAGNITTGAKIVAVDSRRV